MTLRLVLSIVAALMLGACGKPSGTVTETRTKTTTSAPVSQAAAVAQPTATTSTRDTMPLPRTTTSDTAGKEEVVKDIGSPSYVQPGSRDDPTGGYFLAGRVPKEFAEIEHLSLATIDENAKPAPLNGFIRPKSRRAADYRLIYPSMVFDPNLDLNREVMDLSFSTVRVGGVSYSFRGQFTRLGFSADPPASDEVVLKGTLTKMREGKVLLERPVAFTYSAGG